VAVLIDTSILIAYERGQIDVAARVVDRKDEEAFLSVIAASELLHGVHRATNPAIQSKRQTFVEGVLSQFPVLDIDLETARTHAALWSHLVQKGEMIGVHDSWIAATCMAHDLTLLTANTREFDRVPGLKLENWLSP
jgi:tRNA(fMet)-specific endonuclease VapC